MSVTLERMRWWHIEELMGLERELFGEEPWSPGLFWSELGQLDTRHYLVALASGELVGYAGLCAYPDEGFVQTLAVAPGHQGRGVGRQLLSALLDEAQRRRLPVVGLEVRADNLRARALYLGCGFTQIGVRRGYYQPSGTDALVLQVPLARRTDRRPA